MANSSAKPQVFAAGWCRGGSLASPGSEREARPPGENGQALAIVRALARRIAAPAMPRPPITRAQLAGSRGPWASMP